MKTMLLMLRVSCMLFAALGAAQAGTYTFNPVPRDIGDFDHHYYYSWGIDWVIPTNETIVGGTLSIDSINDWTVENGDMLYIHILDNPPSGVRSYYDGQGGGDAYASAGPLVGTYSDENGSAPEDISFDLGELGLIDELTAFAADGRFGFGFDPDCHYYNCAVKLTLNTGESIVPEPGSFVAVFCGLVSLAGLSRRRRL